MSGADPGTETVRQDPEGEAATDPTPEAEDPPAWEAVDDMFDVLSNHRRRRVLTYLEANETAVVGELAEHIASIENKKPVSALSSQERKRVYIALYQSHLPKMAAAGVVDYDKNRGTVSPTDDAAELCSLLESPVRSRRWSAYYLAHTAATALGVAIGTVLLNVSIAVVAIVFLVGYALLAIVHGTAEYAGSTSERPLDADDASR